MHFSVGIWDTLFGERIQLEIPDSCGNTVRRSVTKKWFELMKNQESILSLYKQVLRVHMLDVVKGYRVLYWVVGENIDEATARMFMNQDTGDIYAIYYYEQDEPKTEVLTKKRWDIAYNKIYGESTEVKNQVISPSTS